MGWTGSLEEAEELLSLAQEAGQLGVFEWQIETGEMRVSPQFLALYGLSDFSGRHQSWLDCVFREDQPRLADILETAITAREPLSRVEFRIVRPADQALRWIEARILFFYAEDGRVRRAVGVHADITERKRAFVELRRFTETLEERVKERTRELEAENEGRRQAEEALRQAQKMEAVGQLTGGIAHDFNNLLTVVLGGLDIIGRQLPALAHAPEVARITRGREMAAEGARRAAILTSRLLAFSRRQALAPRSLEANRLVADISELLRHTIGEAISLETVLAGGLWRIHADANQLENAILNLALNARDAMPDGGKLTIETANGLLDETYVAGLPEPVTAGRYVLIAVTDTGAGMDGETLERAFEPFFTTKETGKGTGLGLSQVYGFVRQSAGHVRIYSEPGEGTNVKIYLPRHTGVENQREERRIEAGSEGASGIETILVVEDDAALRAYTVETLSELGYRVMQAADGASALALVESEPAIDLLFTDVVMPGGMNGRELADEALRRRPDLKVLYTTGYTRNAIVHHGRLDAGVQMIGKPFSFDNLARKVRVLLDRD